MAALAVKIRVQLGEEGCYDGPLSVLASRPDDGLPAPSESTRSRLPGRGLVTPQPQKCPTSAGRRYQRSKPNELALRRFELAAGRRHQGVCAATARRLLTARPGHHRRSQRERRGHPADAGRGVQGQRDPSGVAHRQRRSVQPTPPRLRRDGRHLAAHTGGTPDHRQRPATARQRQGRTQPPNPAEMAVRPAPGRHARGVAIPTRRDTGSTTTTDLTRRWAARLPTRCGNSCPTPARPPRAASR